MPRLEIEPLPKVSCRVPLTPRFCQVLCETCFNSRVPSWRYVHGTSTKRYGFSMSFPLIVHIRISPSPLEPDWLERNGRSRLALLKRRGRQRRRFTWRLCRGHGFISRPLEFFKVCFRATGASRPLSASPIRENPASLSLVAECVVANLGRLDLASRQLIFDEAARRPIRWREPLRLQLNDEDRDTQFAVALILDKVGAAEDIPRLRQASRNLRGVSGAANLGRGLARRLAPLVFVEDQGRVQVHIGSELTHGSDIRRKVLALLVLPALATELVSDDETRSWTPCGPILDPMSPSTR